MIVVENPRKPVPVPGFPRVSLNNLRPINAKVVSLNPVLAQIGEQLLLNPGLNHCSQPFDLVRQ